jgi:hypothetical protein
MIDHRLPAGTSDHVTEKEYPHRSTFRLWFICARAAVQHRPQRRLWDGYEARIPPRPGIFTRT